VNTQRVSVSDKAKQVIDQLREQHGELMFHQSGGCCDGSAPMCFEKGGFLLGSRDLLLGEIHGCKFYMAASFSLEIPLGLRFMAVSRLFTDAELENLQPIETR